MYPEQRIPAVIEHAVIELLVFIFGAVGGLLGPQRRLVVYGNILNRICSIFLSLLLCFLLPLGFSFFVKLICLNIDIVDVCRCEIAVLP